MKRQTTIPLLMLASFVLLAVPVALAQHGGGGSHGGGGGSRGGGGLGGGHAFSSGRTFSGGGSIKGQASRGASGYRGGMGAAPYRGGYVNRPGNLSGGYRYRPASNAGARPEYAPGNSSRRGGMDGNLRRRRGQPYRNRYGYGYGYAGFYGYPGYGFFDGFPDDLMYDGYDQSDDLGYGYDAPDNSQYDDSQYGDGQYQDPNQGYAPGQDQSDPSEAPDNQPPVQPGYGSGYAAPSPQQGQPQSRGAYQPYPNSGTPQYYQAPGLSYPPSGQRALDLKPQPVTILFKDGRAPEQIHNYLLSRSMLTVLDSQGREIPVNQIDVPATVQVNRQAGVDFHLPAAAR